MMWPWLEREDVFELLVGEVPEASHVEFFPGGVDANADT